MKQGLVPPLKKLMLGVATLVALVALPAAAQASSTVWAVGDGAAVGPTDNLVGAMVNQNPFDAFLYLGDVYDSGTSAEFNYYDEAYGAYKNKSYPTPGNHEWNNRAAGYDPYWGPALSSPHYYSLDVGSWHVISLNTEESGGLGSAQVAWLRTDLASHPGTCTMAFWHRPRYSATSQVNSTYSIGDDTKSAGLWQTLAGHASIVLTGHAHNYQRLNPIDGMTEFVVGTGGEANEHHTFTGPDSRLAASNDTDFGALKMVLEPGRADFSMMKLGGGVLDSGSIGCKTAPSVSTGSASGVGTNAATLAGTVDPNSDATSYYFEYGTTAQYGSQSPTVAAGSGSEPQAVSTSLSNLTPGTTYHYRLVATNSLGTSATTDKTFTTSTTTTTTPPPATTITAGPSGTIATTSAQFSFSSVAGASFQCKLDAASYASCSSPKAYSSLTQGSHTFSVTATDPGGTTGPAATRSFIVDTAPPNTTITSGPGQGSTTKNRTPTFSFTSTEAGSTFQCRVDGGSYSSCTSPKTLATLSYASHTFYVRAIDPAGNVDPTPASRGFKVHK